MVLDAWTMVIAFGRMIKCWAPNPTGHNAPIQIMIHSGYCTCNARTTRQRCSCTASMQLAATVAPSRPAPFSFTNGDRICPGLLGGAVCDTDVPAKTALASIFSAVAVTAMAVVSWWWGYNKARQQALQNALVKM